MLSDVMQDSLNDQINTEFSSAYAYLAMSAFCEYENFRGCAQWLRVQSEEEQRHGMKIYDFMLARNCPVVLKEITAPRTTFESIPQVFALALEQEAAVTQRIDALYELASREKAFAALVELQWFINEQVEEERTARNIVAKFDLVKDDPSALLDLDRELGERSDVDSSSPPAA